ncbi:MAG: excinuclease ABC subunit UvrA [Planctomycetota bacterium]
MPTAPDAADHPPVAGRPAPVEPIRVRGAQTHNLRDVDLDIPRGALTVFCGVSGSGKTSMAIDTLYAEGQRRYIESFSAYTRQFLERLDKPDCDGIDGLPPAIAVTRGGSSRSNRATVATATEVADHLRLLYARAGRVVCDACDVEVRRDTLDAIVDHIVAEPEGRRLLLGFEASLGEDAAAALADLIEAGYVRGLVGREVVRLPDLAAGEPPTELTVVVDRLVGGHTDPSRVAESVEAALDGGDGACVVVAADEPEATPLRFDTRLRCNGCDREFTPPEPRLFNFNNPLGACPECEGFGSVVETDMDLVVPDKTLSLRDGAIAPWRTPAYEHELRELLDLAEEFGVDPDAPFEQLPPEAVRVVVHGVPERDFGGLDGFIRWLERRKYKMHLRVFLSRWRSYRPCPACGGDRLNPDALAVRFDGRTFADVCRMEVREAAAWLRSVGDADLSFAESAIARTILGDVRARLEYLEQVGVGYLTLDRTLRTLSTGEAGRVAMTATLGSNLVDMLYVLDEPSTGLHPADVPALVEALRRLRDRGNTVVAIEHEEEAIRRADRIVEFGPHAGVEGGEIVFEGTPDALLDADGDSTASVTGEWVAGRRVVGKSADRRRPAGGPRLTLIGARGANLGEGDGLDVEFPLGVLTVVTGVSGAGKSSLVRRTLAPALADRLQDAGGGKSGGDSRHEADRPLPCRDVLGHNQLDEVLLVDQSPIGRSPRSNPVTYVKAMDPIRALFAELPDAKARGYTASHFSFNVDGGRCEACQGAGSVEIDMQFLADVSVRCGECHGTRYRAEVLEVRYRDRDIAEVLAMTVSEAIRFFRGEAKVQQRLRPLADVGLGYIQLGQPAATLSGGEAQRLKLAGRLSAKGAGRTLFVLDEPTTGLHPSDVAQLVECLDALVDVGHSVLVVEHNVAVMMAADWVIDLGPGAAADGGRVVAAGTPEEVAACNASATGRVLAEAFARREAAMADLEAAEAAMADED